MKKNVVLILAVFLFQSCYFGVGAIEINLPGNYFLFGNNSIEETALWFKTGEHSSEIIIKETVFAVGFNKDFIIAKSSNRNLGPIFGDKNPEFRTNIENDNSILYHILNLKEKSPKKSKGMDFTEYKTRRKELNLSEDLDFTIILNEVVKD